MKPRGGETKFDARTKNTLNTHGSGHFGVRQNKTACLQWVKARPSGDNLKRGRTALIFNDPPSSQPRLFYRYFWNIMIHTRCSCNFVKRSQMVFNRRFAAIERLLCGTALFSLAAGPVCSEPPARQPTAAAAGPSARTAAGDSDGVPCTSGATERSRSLIRVDVRRGPSTRPLNRLHCPVPLGRMHGPRNAAFRPLSFSAAFQRRARGDAQGIGRPTCSRRDSRGPA